MYFPKSGYRPKAAVRRKKAGWVACRSNHRERWLELRSGRDAGKVRVKDEQLPGAMMTGSMGRTIEEAVEAAMPADGCAAFEKRMINSSFSTDAAALSIHCPTKR